jgi:hypothetical protein
MRLPRSRVSECAASLSGYSLVALIDCLLFLVETVIIGGAVSYPDAGRADYVARVPAFDPRREGQVNLTVLFKKTKLIDQETDFRGLDWLLEV